MSVQTDEVDFNEAAIAEMLLDLSHSPSCSPSSANHAKEEVSDLLPGTRKRRSTFDWSRYEQDDSEEEEILDSPASRKRGRTEKAAKRVPGRCKCGKRISAAHPPCKSELMLLCERFRDTFGHLSDSGEPTRIHLNECATELGVPRRRLYDITIVYEAAEVVKRTGKLAYVWRGTAHLPELVEQLKREEETQQPVGDRRGLALPTQHERQTTHSLWTLSRKFIRLLLTKEGPIQLTEAAKHLIGDTGKGGKRQQTQLTVERRLYDIGSILSTLHLIRRTYVEGKRQPAFSWNWDRADEGALPKSPPSSQAEHSFAAPEPPSQPAKSPPSGNAEPRDMQRRGSDTSSNQSTASEQSWAETRAEAFPRSSHFASLKGVSSPLAFSSPLLQTPWSLPQFFQDVPPSVRLSLAGLGNSLFPAAPLQLAQPPLPLQLGPGIGATSPPATLCKPLAISAAAASGAASPQLHSQTL